MREMEQLEKVENQTFSRFQMTKQQKKFHTKQMQEATQDNLSRIDAFQDLENILANRSEKIKESQEYGVGNRHLTKIKTNFDKSMKQMKNKGNAF